MSGLPERPSPRVLRAYARSMRAKAAATGGRFGAAFGARADTAERLAAETDTDTRPAEETTR